MGIRCYSSKNFHQINKLLKECLEVCQKANQICTIGGFVKYSFIPRASINHYGINKVIIAANKKYLKESEVDEIARCRKVAGKFVTEKSVIGQSFSTRDLYKSLDRSYSWIKEKSPELFLWINKRVDKSHEQARKLSLLERKRRSKMLLAI